MPHLRLTTQNKLHLGLTGPRGRRKLLRHPSLLNLATTCIQYLIRTMISVKRDNFEGNMYRLSDRWFSVVPVTGVPFRYLEIGVCCGSNLISVAQSYCAHESSELTAVDVWSDYDSLGCAYRKFKGTSNINFERFKRNIERHGIASKVVIKRGFSSTEIPKLFDDYYDLVYVDGNHISNFALEDAVLSFRKLKIGGYMVFDDYDDPSSEGNTSREGIDAFTAAYRNLIRVVALKDFQFFIKRLK